MHRFIAVLLVLLFQSLNAADVTKIIGHGSSQVIIPAAIQLIQLDHQAIQSPEIPYGHYQINLEPGSHQLVLQYLENWNDNDEAGMIVESKPVILRFDFAANQHYQLLIPTISSYDEAVTFVENMDVVLQQHGKPLARTLQASDVQTEDSSRLKTMKSLWQAATVEERQAFQVWLGTQ